MNTIPCEAFESVQSFTLVVDNHPSSSNKNPESPSVHDMEEEDGTTEGPCPFTVYGLTDEEFSTKTMKTIKAIAL